MHSRETLEVQMIPVHIGHPLDYSNFCIVSLNHRLQLLSLCKNHSYFLKITIILKYFPACCFRGSPSNLRLTLDMYLGASKMDIWTFMTR